MGSRRRCALETAGIAPLDRSFGPKSEPEKSTPDDSVFEVLGLARALLSMTTMKISQCLLVASLGIVAAVVLPTTSAQALSNINCIPGYLPGNTGLDYKLCSTGGIRTLESTAWLTNKSKTTQYVQYIVVTNNMGGFESCQINAWLAPGVTKQCNLLSYAQPNMLPNYYFSWGKISYWSPTLKAYKVYEVQGAPTYVY